MKTIRQKLITALTAAVACFLLIPTAAADKVTLDDCIIVGSACIGQDCVNGESFGFDTLRLKENNLRIRAMDTSNSASFPTNDWQITFNDTSNGGANKFAIDDIDGGRTPFTILAGAPSNSLFVHSSGRVGLGTATPTVNLHVKTGNTPTLRLEQDGTSGFTAQSWDVAGNEANFFVRDVTNGSTLPFRIEPGAPSSAIYIDSTGNIGLGKSSPSSAFHINRSGVVLSDVQSTNDMPVQHRLISSSANRRFVATDGTTVQSQLIFGNSEVKIAGTTDSTNLFATFNANGLSLPASAFCGANGAAPAAGGCDAVFTPEYDVESIEEHAEFMWENSHLPAVGPTPDGEQITFSVTQRHFGMLNELEKAHIYIERLNERLKDKASQVDELNERLARLEALVAPSKRND